MDQQFIAKVNEYYHTHGRNLPWRDITQLPVKDRGYRVLVSEVMLQQTQVSRVISKYNAWLQRWPTLDDFIQASLAEVLATWSGLGYNRRAKYLYQTLHILHEQYGGSIPKDPTILTKLPGIGRNTAAAVLVYTYDMAVAFVETNIRTVYLHEYFHDTDQKVADAEILQLVQHTQDTVQPRQWYYALMDYGTFLKQSKQSVLNKAKSYTTQSTFHGSKRQVRGKIIKYLIEHSPADIHELQDHIDDERLADVLQELKAEGLLVMGTDSHFSLPLR